MFTEVIGGLVAYGLVLLVCYMLAKASSIDCESYYNDPDVH